METREQLQQELALVEKWVQEQGDLWWWEKLGRLPFVLLDKVTPKFLQEKIGQVLDELASYVETGGQYLIDEKSVLTRFQDKTNAAVLTREQVADLPMSLMNEVAEELGKSRSRFATFQGATTGIGGIFTLAIDIPLLIGLSLKVLQEMAISYGYDPQDRQERIFMVKCLQFTSSDIVGKKAILDELAQFGDAAAPRGQGIAQLQGWREVIMTYRDNYGWKKLFQLIPVAGILFGAYLNRKTIEDVAETGRMLYRKRRALENLQKKDASV